MKNVNLIRKRSLLTCTALTITLTGTALCTSALANQNAASDTVPAVSGSVSDLDKVIYDKNGISIRLSDILVGESSVVLEFTNETDEPLMLAPAGDGEEEAGGTDAAQSGDEQIIIGTGEAASVPVPLTNGGGSLVITIGDTPHEFRFAAARDTKDPIKVYETKIDVLTSQKESLVSDNESLTGMLESKTQETEQLAADLAEMTLQAEALTDSLEAKTEEAQLLSEALEESAKEAESLGVSLEDKTKEAEDLRASLEENTKEAESLGASLEEKTKEAESLGVSLEEKTKEAEELGASLEAKTAEAGELGTALENKTIEYDALSSEKMALEGELASRNETIAGLEELVSRMEADNDGLRLEIDPGLMDESMLTSELLSNNTIEYFDWAAVRAVQIALNREGFDCGKVDGVWGPHTEAGILSYEKDAGLTENGIITEELIRSMMDRGILEGSILNADEPSLYLTWHRYDLLCSGADNLVGTRLKITGKILQAVSPSEGHPGYMRLALDDDNRQVVFVTMQDSAVKDGIREFGEADVYGRTIGHYIYTGKTGEETELPWMMADRIEAE